jgi:lysozyme-related protein Hpa2
MNSTIAPPKYPVPLTPFVRGAGRCGMLERSSTRMFGAGQSALRALLLAALWGAGPALAQPPTLTECVAQASSYYTVNPAVLSAILKVESGFQPHAVNRNGNGTIDIGIAQINSIHLRELARSGIGAQHLLDYCTGTYVAAWHLRRQMLRYGDTWFAIGAYHSVTPHLNAAYQQRVIKALRQWGYIRSAQ